MSQKIGHHDDGLRSLLWVGVGAAEENPENPLEKRAAEEERCYWELCIVLVWWSEGIVQFQPSLVSLKQEEQSERAFQ